MDCQVRDLFSILLNNFNPNSITKYIYMPRMESYLGWLESCLALETELIWRLIGDSSSLDHLEGVDTSLGGRIIKPS